MAESVSTGAEGAFEKGAQVAVASTPGRQAYQLLHFAFAFAPIVAGLDKFFHLLVNWDIYLAPVIARLSLIGGHNLMRVVGVIEIVAGLLVALKPRIGAYVVAVWLWAIIINLLLIPNYFDIALRDIGLSLGALALARLSLEFGGSGLSKAGPNKDVRR